MESTDPPRPAQLILSVPDAAAIVGRSSSWVWRAIRRGETFGGAVRHRPGRHIEISRALLLAWVAEHRTTRRWLSAREAGELLGRSDAWVRRELREGETFGGAYTPETGQRIRIDEDLLRGWCDGGGDVQPLAS